MSFNQTWISQETRTFAGFPVWTDDAARDAEVLIIGLPYVTPYPGEDAVLAPGAEDIMAMPGVDPGDAPGAIRAISQHYVGFLHNYDFEMGGGLFAGREVKIYDCGDLRMDPDDDAENRRRATSAVRSIVTNGTIPIVIGGDHATTIPVVRAYEGLGPMCIIQIDAHLDWRDEVGGMREGYSSPMRRAAEMPWVQSMVQIGLRGLGSAGQREVDEARAFGSVLIRAEELYIAGMQEILQMVPDCENYYITLDMDGLDPAIAPGVIAPAPGGMDYYQVTQLIRGIAQRGRIVGFDLVEVTPKLDPTKITCLLASRLILNLIGSLSYEGQIGAPRA